MAEAIGLVSSTITLAQITGELGTLGFKLKLLWDQIHDVPDHIEALFREIQILGSILSDINGYISAQSLHSVPWTDHTFSGCTLYCKEAFDNLSRIVNDISGEISSASPIRKKLVAARVVLKRHKLDALESRLKRATTMLHLCLQYYSMVLAKASYEVNSEIRTVLRENHNFWTIRGEASQDQTSPHAARHWKAVDVRQKTSLCSTNHKYYVSTIFGSLSISVSSKYASLVVTLHPPLWLIGIAWGVTARRSLQQLSLRYYNVRARKSSVFDCVRKNDISGLLQQFTDKAASPFDRDEEGLSLLHHAASSNRLEICEKLLEIGLGDFIDERVVGYVTPCESALLGSLWMGGDDAEKNLTRFFDLFQSFRSNSEPIDDCQLFLVGCTSGRCSVRVLSRFQSFIAPSFYSLPKRERFDIARAYCCTTLLGHCLDPSIFKILIRENMTLVSDDVAQSSQWGASILHTVAIALGRTCKTAASVPDMQYQVQITEWQKTVCEVVGLSQPGELHFVEDVRQGHSPSIDTLVSNPEWVGTPLLSVLKSICLEDFIEVKADNGGLQDLWVLVSSIALRGWLEQMLNCGVSLIEYGQKEKEIFKGLALASRGDLTFTLTVSLWSKEKQAYFKESYLAYLLDFDVGNCPDAWILYWKFGVGNGISVPENTRQMQSASTPSLPGAWVD